jgi:hypothetical protein
VASACVEGGSAATARRWALAWQHRHRFDVVLPSYLHGGTGQMTHSASACWAAIKAWCQIWPPCRATRICCLSGACTPAVTKPDPPSRWAGEFQHTSCYSLSAPPCSLLQVSRLVKPAGGGSAPQTLHWFTATPDPQRSVYKPFAFPQHPGNGQQLVADPAGGSSYTVALPAPRNPPHPLWKAWQSVYEARGASKPSQSALKELEARCLDSKSGPTFAQAVEEEMRLYGAL